MNSRGFSQAQIGSSGMAFFTVVENGNLLAGDGFERAYLLSDNWNDWFKYRTLYSLIYLDEAGGRHSIGGVKIGQFDMRDEQQSPDIPAQFDALDERFFSLGQDDSYYSALNELGDDVRDRILHALRDFVRDGDLFEQALAQDVTGESLLRSVTRATVVGQFRRMALGGARLTGFQFTYTSKQHLPLGNTLTMGFNVKPESYPPSNVHVLIGRNGVGKTTLLNDIAQAIVNSNIGDQEFGTFASEGENIGDQLFANLVSVTFSAFDTFEPLPIVENRAQGVQYAYIGLKEVNRMEDGTPMPPKNPEALSSDFGASVLICRQGAKVARWQRALEMLQADPIFSEAEVSVLARDNVPRDQIRDEAVTIFQRLSSGHKIVLLTITRLVETVEEKTLILLDEPEAHLHPPLLSAFVRALSELLIDRNGIALVATHSPVVLQEVPQNCVWLLRRAGAYSVAERPEIQTFGENVGVLTREVFKLEVSHSGFHNMLKVAVDELRDYDQVVQKFNGALGDEARAIVQGLLAAQLDDDEAF
jgi:predicted ATPase